MPKNRKVPTARRQRLRQGLILLSFFLFPATFYYLSPVLIVEAAAAGVVNGSFVVFGALFVSALFFGRGYCGWVCPGAGCQEALLRVRDDRVRRGQWLKWVIWVPWITVIAVLAWRAGGYQRIEMLYRTTYGLSIGDIGGLIAYLLVLLLLIVLPALSVGRRSFCHHLCWMAPFMILGRWLGNQFKWPALRLRAAPDACRHCHACTATCPMSLPVEKMVVRGEMENSACILCGSCADSCPEGVIRLEFD